MTRYRFAGSVRLIILTSLCLSVGAVRPVQAAKARVQLHPSVSAIVAGEPFEVACKFDVAKGWHIYWKNAGDAGLPPKAEWKLPQGFTVGELRFPVPKRHTDSVGTVTNILEGEPVLLVTVTPPKDLGSAKSVKLTADWKWLVCDKQCLLESQVAEVSLPIVAQAAAVKPANADLFAAAKMRLPVSAEKAKYISITPRLGKGKLAPGESFEIHLEVVIKRGFHIQSNKPLTPGLIATDVFIEPVDAVFFDRAIYPKPKIKMDPKLGKLSEFGGKIEIRIPAEADTELKGDSREIGGVLNCQACDERTGQCYPPQGVRWSLSIPIGLAGGPSVRPEPGDTPATPAEALAKTVFVETEVPSDESDTSVALSTENVPVPVPVAGGGGEGLENYLKGLGLPGLLLGCFLYGLFINATPCVLPLLSIKVLGFVQQAHESRRRTFALGMSFGVGVMLLFILLGLLASRGGNLLHNTGAVIALGAIVTAMALSMLGVFTLQVPTAATKIEATIQQEGLLASFGKGTLAPVLGFACTGPLMAGAFGWATQQSPQIAFVAFLFMGIGMASPYMLLGANPNWLSFLPKPGQWMITFERIMGFLLLAMVIWLLHPLGSRVGATGLEFTLAFLVAVAMGCWVLGRIDLTMSTAVRWRYRVVAAGIVLVSGVLIYGVIYPLDEARERMIALQSTQGSSGDDWSNGIPWQKWSEEKVVDAVSRGNVVFVDFTADYCTTCKKNKIAAINTAAVREKMKSCGVVALKGDFSTGDPKIFAALQAHQRAGVPLNLLYGPGRPDQPLVLPIDLSKQLLLNKLDAVCPSRLAGIRP